MDRKETEKINKEILKVLFSTFLEEFCMEEFLKE